MEQQVEQQEEEQDIYVAMSGMLEPFFKQLTGRSMPTQQDPQQQNNNNADTDTAEAPIATHGHHQPSMEPVSLPELLKNLDIVGIEPDDEDGDPPGFDVLDEVLRTQSASAWIKMVREMESDRSKMLPP